MQIAILRNLVPLKVRNSGGNHEQLVVSTAKLLGSILEKSILQQALFGHIRLSVSDIACEQLGAVHLNKTAHC